MFKNRTQLIIGGIGSFGNVVFNRFPGNDIQQHLSDRDKKAAIGLNYSFGLGIFVSQLK